MRYILAAMATLAVVTIAAAPARAQLGGTGGGQKTPLELQYEREAKERAENEKDYNATMKRLKAQGATTTNSDPWKTVRPSAEPKR